MLFLTMAVASPQSAFAAGKTQITDMDTEIDYYAVLGLSPVPEPTYQQIVSAFRKKIKELHPTNKDGVAPLKSYDAQLLVDAKTVLTDPKLHSEYMLKVSERAQQKLGLRVFRAANGHGGHYAAPENPIDLSQLLRGEGAGKAVLQFNQTHLTQDVDFYRRNPDRNYVAQRAQEHVEAPPRNLNFKPSNYPQNLEEKWTQWSPEMDPKALQIKNELARIAQWALTEKVENFKPPFKRAQSFFYWWFQQPESILFPKIVTEALSQMPPGNVVTKELMQASVSEAVWRTREWFEFLKPQKLSYFALAPVMGTPEFETEQDLIESVARLPDGENYRHLLMEALIPSPLSVRHPEWIESQISDENLAYFFIQYASNQPHWRKFRPQAFTKAILLLGERQTSRDGIIDTLLTKADSINHPEWLGILIKTDTNNGIALKLNQLLALEPWFSSTYLKQILGNNRLSLPALKAADWSAPPALTHEQPLRIEQKRGLPILCPGLLK
jgi:hypothetical protein